MPEIVHFDGGVDAEQERYFFFASIFTFDYKSDVLLRLEAAYIREAELLIALERKRLDGIMPLELQRKHAHSYEIGTMDALEALRDHRLYAEELGAFGRPIP